MSWRDVFSVLAEVVVQRLPSLLSRLIYSRDRLTREVELDVRSTHALSFSLGHTPNAWCYLRLTNMSPIAVEVLTVEVEVWDQQPLCNLQYQAHEMVTAKTTKEIHCGGFLNEWQERRVHEARTQERPFSVSARLVLKTVHGTQELRFYHKEGVRADISGTPASVVAAR